MGGWGIVTVETLLFYIVVWCKVLICHVERNGIEFMHPISFSLKMLGDLYPYLVVKEIFYLT